MVYNSNRQYNTRHSVGRYNTPGQFVAAGAPGQQQRFQQRPPQPSPQRQQLQHQPSPQRQQLQQQLPPQQQSSFVPPLPPPPEPKFAQRTNQAATNKYEEMEEADTEMKTEVPSDINEGNDEGNRPSWMKIKKINKKERRRRQNRHLRRLITPKNALMVLNEMMLGEHLATQQFKVEPAEVNQYYKDMRTNFCAELTLHGVSYKGYGETKMGARNAAAEQAIRDLILKRMQKSSTADAANSGGEGEAEADGADGEETLPMIQLASFALHKLFSEWEYDGHKVPQLRPAGPPADGPADGAGPEAPPPKARAPRPLPANAAAMHPCTLLTYMRPALDYRELAVDGDRPQNIVFTMGVDVDGTTYIGKASNKKEARRLAAKAACMAVFGVHFDDVSTATRPEIGTTA